ncbi:MAG: hypothetical protein KC776_26985 [Myxococcales bacterium]|nr:hypothetical protein [Myxococcales bacterium]MCB9575409.1 hypothetical protein [Polyangiaceae bacterium]
MADDEEREEEKSESKKAAPAASRADDEVVALLKEIRELMIAGRESQNRYIWLLFPIMAFLLIQTLLLAARLQ